MTVPSVKHDYVAPTAVDSLEMLLIGVGNEISVEEASSPASDVSKKKT